MVPGAQGMLHLFSQQGSAQGQTATQTLGGGDNIRLHAVVHIGVELSGAAVAGLNFIDHQQYILLLAKLSGGLDEVGVQGYHAPFALDALQKKPRHFVLGESLLQGGNVVGGGMDEAWGKGLEQFVIVGLAGGGQGGDGPTMEAVFQGHNGVVFRPLLVAGILPCGFDGAFVGLCAGVGEEDLFHPGFLAQLLGQQNTGLGVVEIGGVLQHAQLRRHRLLPLLVGDTEGGDADAAAHVDVALAIFIINQGTFSPHQGNGEPGVGARHIGFIQLLQIRHCFILLLPWYRRLRR